MSAFPVRSFLLAWVSLAVSCGGTSPATAPPPRQGDSTSSNPSQPSGGTLGNKLVFPVDNPWNRDISSDPVDPGSAAMVASCGSSSAVHPDFGTVYNGAPNGIPYIVVRAGQATVPVTFSYASESDPGPYPVPLDAPIEGGSASTGDRHVIVVDVDAWKLYELYDAHPGGSSWTAGSGAVFDLSSNALRPAGWTSADAAGLPIFPGLVRYDEVAAGSIAHALRMTCPRTRKGYVSPARHQAGSGTDPSLPPMGARFRLKASVDISTFPPQVQVILKAMKKYGMFLADNGSAFYVSGAPDSRWDDNGLRNLSKLHGSDFEVVQLGAIAGP